MRLVMFAHSLLSDWNHGNAHFLRGVAWELKSRGHEVAVFEPRDAWSLANLRADHGDAPLAAFRRAYPGLEPIRYDPDALDLDRALDGADVVVVHEWNDPELVRRIGRRRARGGRFRLLFHDTHHRCVSDPESLPAEDLEPFDGVLAFGEAIREAYLARGWSRRAWTWHEAADTRVFRPIEGLDREWDLVWVGNWGDEERSAELHEFLLGPVRDLGLRARVHGVRYPAEARAALAEAGIDYVGWLANFEVPSAFARSRVTVHVPRRPYVVALPGIPTIRMFEALACGIPLVSAPWDDREGLFRPGGDYLIARDGHQMRRHLRDLLNDEAMARALARRGRETILERHTCIHRVDELLAICRGLGLAPRRLAPGGTMEERGQPGAAVPPRPFDATEPCPVPWPRRPSSDPPRLARGPTMSEGPGVSIAFFGSSLVSAYWNGAATYYRGIIRALHRRGHRVTFYEPDAYSRQEHRDIPDPPWARVVVYPASPEGLGRALDDARDADVIVKASGVGVFDRELEAAVPEVRRPGGLAVFWDVDAPATLDRIECDPEDPSRGLIPRYDFVFTYGGGDPVVAAYRALGARGCVPIYNALDPATHHPVPPDPRFAADLGFLGNRLPDREARVEEFFLRAAGRCPGARFLLGGAGWDDKARPENVNYIGHVYTRDHNAFNVTPRAVLNVSRESMARNGFSPATRVFEAAGAGACLITDAWEGIGQFLEPGREVLVARDGEEVAEQLRALTPERARSLGAAARRRVLAEHTYDHRAAEVEGLLVGGPAACGGIRP